jgi:hypothetical protein
MSLARDIFATLGINRFHIINWDSGNPNIII